jgi:hypothetical protein
MSSMSATYFVLPPAGTSWKMELNSFEKALRERWPDAIVERPAQSTRNKWSGGVEWALGLAPDAKTRSVAGRWLDACLSRDGQATALKGDPALVAEYSVWLRHWQPDAPLVVLSDAGGTLLELTDTTTPDEVEAHLAR